MTTHIVFRDGTLIVDGDAETLAPLGERIVHDPRIGKYRARAIHYGEILTYLHKQGLPFQDDARAFEPLPLSLQTKLTPRDYQAAAVSAWLEARWRGMVILPTGSGKSYVAQLAMAKVQRPTLVVAPTIDLMQQWASQLEQAFGQPVGMLGGGSKDVQPITTSTYDSAAMMMEYIGNLFGMLIVDECHHLPGPTNRQLAEMCIAPFRLGLTATPDREDGGDAVMAELIGPIVFRLEIDELEGLVLAPYRTECLECELEEDEAQAYQEERAIYLDFVRNNGISFSSPSGWTQFVALCARQPGGRRAFKAYMNQKRIARASRAKFRTLWELMQTHAGERMIIFTADNETAYTIGRRFLLPVLTHHTKAKERKDFLTAFRSGEYPVLVTSKVLNEGIDVPEASVGVVVSGSGSTREHVQRLGRILRPGKGKQATLYELVSMGTSEFYVSDRRRQHRAYQRSH